MAIEDFVPDIELARGYFETGETSDDPRSTVHINGRFTILDEARLLELLREADKRSTTPKRLGHVANPSTISDNITN